MVVALEPLEQQDPQEPLVPPDLKDPLVPQAPEPQDQLAHKVPPAYKAYKVCKVLWVPQVPLGSQVPQV